MCLSIFLREKEASDISEIIQMHIPCHRNSFLFPICVLPGHSLLRNPFPNKEKVLLLCCPVAFLSILQHTGYNS